MPITAVPPPRLAHTEPIQQGHQTMTHYLVMAMRKPTFPESVIQPHRDFLAALRAQGLLELTGGFADGSGGAYVLKNVANLEQARAIVAEDPLLLQNASELTIYAWNTH